MIILEVKNYEGYSLLMDSTGYICGCYNNEAEAAKVLLQVQENINRGKLHRLCVQEIKNRYKQTKKFTKKKK